MSPLTFHPGKTRIPSFLYEQFTDFDHRRKTRFTSLLTRQEILQHNPNFALEAVASVEVRLHRDQQQLLSGGEEHVTERGIRKPSVCQFGCRQASSSLSSLPIDTRTILILSHRVVWLSGSLDTSSDTNGETLH
ncbi:hypothetical protein TNCV_2967041 [Trichonephila clavipes]|nr:hypothetical protein TNCV_2967041 [Trichonephila clavipes]